MFNIDLISAICSYFKLLNFKKIRRESNDIES